MKFLTLFILTLFCASLWAQTEKPAVKLTVLSLDSRILDLKYESAGEVQSLYAFKNQRSQPFMYRGEQPIVFFRELSQTDAAGNPLRQQVAQCQLPGNSRQYMLIMSKRESEAEAYRCFAIDDNWGTFSAGTYRFLNLAPFTIALKLDDKVYEIKKQNFTDVSGNVEDGTHQQAMMVSLPEGEDPLPVFEGLIQYTENLRMLYIISPKPGGRVGRVNFTAIPQRVPKVPSSTPSSAQ